MSLKMDLSNFNANNIYSAEIAKEKFSGYGAFQDESTVGLFEKTKSLQELVSEKISEEAQVFCKSFDLVLGICGKYDVEKNKYFLFKEDDIVLVCFALGDGTDQESYTLSASKVHNIFIRKADGMMMFNVTPTDAQGKELNPQLVTLFSVDRVLKFKD